jgi:hypothetical protein
MTGLGLGRVKTLLHDADRRGRTQATAVRSIWANFTSHSPELIMTQCRGSFFRRPMNRNGARQRPYHALTAASSGFIPTMFSTRVRLYQSTHSAISVATFGSVTHKKCVAPMRIFSVANRFPA